MGKKRDLGTRSPKELFKTKSKDAWSDDEMIPFQKAKHAKRRSDSRKRTKGYEKAD